MVGEDRRRRLNAVASSEVLRFNFRGDLPSNGDNDPVGLPLFTTTTPEELAPSLLGPYCRTKRDHFTDINKWYYEYIPNLYRVMMNLMTFIG